MIIGTVVGVLPVRLAYLLVIGGCLVNWVLAGVAVTVGR